MLLLTFFYSLRTLKIPVGTQEWLYLMDALSEDLAGSSLDKFYYLARSVLVKSEALYDAFDQAFLACFRDIPAQVNLHDELLEWLNKSLDPASRPQLPKIDPLTLEELRRRLLERLKEQHEEHHGGSKWIGTGGTSPFGHSGAHPSGIRIGGPGGGKMAVKVAEERRFQNYRNDRVLDTRQLKVALKRLRKLNREGIAEELNMEKSIESTCKNAGEIDLVFEAPRKNQTELLLLMDVGGSMDVYAEMAEALFSAAHASNHFKAFHHFYFHNCIYSKLYTDMSRRKTILVDEVFKKFRKSFHVIIVGDACMNPYELFVPGGVIDYWQNEREPGMTWLKRIKDHYPASTWLNPETESFWKSHPTIHAISNIFKMFPLSVEGLTQAIALLKKGQLNPIKLSV
ncbi:MAG: VWA domain-containing protein [Deltaproteobacteria bacterium]|nr:VWA domain-containing protein [Deltaproteobacteria bacterium]